MLLTNREGHGRVRRLQQRLGWPVLVQEQEAYLLPGVDPLETFAEEHRTAAGLRLLWTPGPTPGSCVVHAPAPWNVLFCGRLLVPLGGGSGWFAASTHLSLAAPATQPRTSTRMGGFRSLAITGFWGGAWRLARRASSALECLVAGSACWCFRTWICVKRCGIRHLACRSRPLSIRLARSGKLQRMSTSASSTNRFRNSLPPHEQS